MTEQQQMAKPEERLDLALSVGQILNGRPRDRGEFRIIENLARSLAKDVELAVRKALSHELKTCPFISPDLAHRIAQDVDDVAVPFVEASPVLDEEFLELLIADCSEPVRAAVASRPRLPERVGHAVSVHGDSQSVLRLLGNDSMFGSDRIFINVIDRFSGNEEVAQALTARPGLSLAVIDRLTEMLTVKAGETLVRRYGLAPSLAEYLRRQARRGALQKALDGAPDSEIEAYLQRHHERGNLTADVLLNILDSGSLRAFEKGLSICSGQAAENVSMLLKNASTLGLRILMEMAGFSEETRPVMMASFAEKYGLKKVYGLPRH